MKTKTFLASAGLAISLLMASSAFAAELVKDNSAVFKNFQGMEKMDSLNQHDKALTGAGYWYYYTLYVNGKRVTGKMWVNTCPLTGPGSLSNGHC